ncbi:ribbon-helix-helix domain-containing protein [Thermococcus sp.]|uniref:ribbon-helix-helix domain-containing protein n=1 Tax=Thermococcus sp. TaxID=35749 RepID=UPI00261381CE|nr:ribbon-helix-helix domain-containing protein [Thermococcus sp.]
MATGIKISARIPPALEREMNRLIEAGIYSNRSEIIKEALREFLLKRKYSKTGEDEYAELMLRAIEPILAKDWNSEADAHWNDYGGIEYEPNET